MHSNPLWSESELGTHIPNVGRRLAVRCTLIILVEAVLVAAAIWLSGNVILTPDLVNQREPVAAQMALLAGGLFLAFKWLVIARTFEAMSDVRISGSTSVAAILGTGIVIALVFQPHLPRLLDLSLNGVLGFALLVATTVVIDDLGARHLRQQGVRPLRARAKHVALLGRAGQCRAVADYLAVSASGIGVVGIFEPPPAGQPRAQSAEALNRLIALVRDRVVDEVIVVFSGVDDHELVPLVARLAVCPIDISVWPGQIGIAVASVACGVHASCLPLVRQPIQGWGAIGKRAIDLSLALVGLVWLFPLLVMVAIAVKLESPGPIFFRQWRAGFNQNSLPNLEVSDDAQ